MLAFNSVIHQPTPPQLWDWRRLLSCLFISGPWKQTLCFTHARQALYKLSCILSHEIGICLTIYSKTTVQGDHGFKFCPLKFLKPPTKFSMRPSVSRKTQEEVNRVVCRVGRAAPTDRTQKPACEECLLQVFLYLSPGRSTKLNLTNFSWGPRGRRMTVEEETVDLPLLKTWSQTW